MEITQTYEKLKSDASFLEWQKNHTDAYLAHFFTELDSHLRVGVWEVGFYDGKTDKITTFVVGEAIAVKPEEDVFKEKQTVKRLDLNKVKITADGALRKAKELQLKTYPAQLPLKGIVILQDIDVGRVWNITFITQAFAALNIKIDVGGGEILKHELSTFFDFRVT